MERKNPAAIQVEITEKKDPAEIQVEITPRERVLQKIHVKIMERKCTSYIIPG